MLDEIISLKEQILAAIAAAPDADALEAVRIQYLARSGSLPVLWKKWPRCRKNSAPWWAKPRMKPRRPSQPPTKRAKPT